MPPPAPRGRFVGARGAARLKAYKYSVVDRSLIAPYLQPFWNATVSLFPPWVAPNVITVSGARAWRSICSRAGRKLCPHRRRHPPPPRRRTAPPLESRLGFGGRGRGAGLALLAAPGRAAAGGGDGAAGPAAVPVPDARRDRREAGARAGRPGVPPGGWCANACGRAAPARPQPTPAADSCSCQPPACVRARLAPARSPGAQARRTNSSSPRGAPPAPPPTPPTPEHSPPAASAAGKNTAAPPRSAGELCDHTCDALVVTLAVLSVCSVNRASVRPRRRRTHTLSCPQRRPRGALPAG